MDCQKFRPSTEECVSHPSRNPSPSLLHKENCVEQSRAKLRRASKVCSKRESLSKKSPSFVLCFLSPHTFLCSLSLSPPALLRQVQLVLGLSAGLLFMPAAIALFIPLCARPIALFITSKKCHQHLQQWQGKGYAAQEQWEVGLGQVYCGIDRFIEPAADATWRLKQLLEASSAGNIFKVPSVQSDTSNRR